MLTRGRGQGGQGKDTPAQPQAQEITSYGDSVVTSEKTTVGSQGCLVTPGEMGFPELTDIQAEGRKLMATATTKKEKEEQEDGRTGGEGKRRKLESCWGPGLGKAIINILNGVPTT